MYPGKKLVHSVFGKINYGGLKHNSLYLGLCNAIWWVTEPHCLSTNIGSYLEASGGQISTLYLNIVHFFNTSVN